ncbi:MAG: replication protein [Oscillospiraceae bacterium]|nr:replication protein [Oscillospiraceae bacterium]
MRDTQSRKYIVTINNFLEHGYTRDTIREKITALKSLVYFCAAEEKGLECGTHHIHLYAVFSSGVRFSTMKNVFSLGGDIQPARGSSVDNRAYVSKTGKWENDEKSDTQIDGTFEEWGELPEEHQGGNSIEAAIIERIQDGANNAEILREFPHYLRGLRDVEYVRQTLRAEEHREKWREIETVYIWGATGTGKTRYVMEGCGYSNVYAVNNYKHPFDGYAGESVMLFDEFNSHFRIQDMNNYLDGYPLTLPARYNNKQACYEKVFIISNLDLQEQYTHEKRSQPNVWAAFTRRIHKVIRFMPDGTRREYATGEYLSGAGGWDALPNDTPTPWDDEGTVLPL